MFLEITGESVVDRTCYKQVLVALCVVTHAMKRVVSHGIGKNKHGKWPSILRISHFKRMPKEKIYSSEKVKIQMYFPCIRHSDFSLTTLITFLDNRLYLYKWTTKFNSFLSDLNWQLLNNRITDRCSGLQYWGMHSREWHKTTIELIFANESVTRLNLMR